MKTNTENVKILLGNPKKSLIKLSIPIIFSMLAHTMFQLSDIIWVSGLGADSISAVGFFHPILIFSMAIISGISAGGGTCISQKIGAKDKAGADEIAIQMYILILFESIIFIVPLLLFAKPLFLFMGAAQTIDQTLVYSKIMILSYFFYFFSEGSSTIFRSEGDSKRPMKMYLIGIILNSVLDPLFIYTLGLGVAGAAWASLVSMLIVTMIWGYLLFIKRITYVSIQFRGVGFNRNSIERILRLGIPVTMGQLFFTFMIFANTKIVSYIGGSDGVAIYQGGLRFWYLTLLPMQGIAMALTTVVGVAWGAENFTKVKETFIFALKLALIIEGTLGVLSFIAAPLITMMYTWSNDASRLANDFIIFFRVIATVNLAVVVITLSESLLVGVGEGGKKLQLSISRSILLVVPFALLLGVILDYNLIGVWTGISIGNWLGAFMAVILMSNLFHKMEILHAKA